MTMNAVSFKANGEINPKVKVVGQELLEVAADYGGKHSGARRANEVVQDLVARGVEFAIIKKVKEYTIVAFGELGESTTEPAPSPDDAEVIPDSAAE